MMTAWLQQPFKHKLHSKHRSDLNFRLLVFKYAESVCRHVAANSLQRCKWAGLKRRAESKIRNQKLSLYSAWQDLNLKVQQLSLELKEMIIADCPSSDALTTALRNSQRQGNLWVNSESCAVLSKTNPKSPSASQRKKTLEKLKNNSTALHKYTDDLDDPKSFHCICNTSTMS